jgi:hypothetical protein
MLFFCSIGFVILAMRSLMIAVLARMLTLKYSLPAPTSFHRENHDHD